MNAHDFDIFSKSMAKDYRVLAIDLIGHGESAKPLKPVPAKQHVDIIRDIIYQRHFTKPVVIGHSVGGILGIVYASNYPNELEKLILVDIAPRISTEGNVRRRTPPPKPFKSEKKARAYFKRRFRKFTDEARESAFKYMLARAPDGTIRFKAKRESLEIGSVGGRPIDMWSLVSDIRVPVLLIKGGDSPTVTRGRIEKMSEVIEDFTFVEVKGATHMVPQDAPKDFEEIVRKFIKTW
jgi:2-succinyl-6-hydroxy-2,4-cyclohexadiene-1-carboxylate synthase